MSFTANDVLSKGRRRNNSNKSKRVEILVASKYSSVTNEVYDGYKALERYFEEITNFIDINFM